MGSAMLSAAVETADACDPAIWTDLEGISGFGIREAQAMTN